MGVQAAAPVWYYAPGVGVCVEAAGGSEGAAPFNSLPPAGNFTSALRSASPSAVEPPSRRAKCVIGAAM